MEGRELPVGWSIAPIAELATKVGSGATPKGGQSAYLPAGIPLIRSMNVVFFGFKEDGLAFISEEQANHLSNAEVRTGDVLLNITGASIGRATSAPDWSEGARVNQHVCIIRPSQCIFQDYLSAYLSSPVIQNYIVDENYGVTRQALTKQQVLELEIPVPPLNEQRRIAAKLDTTLAAVDACRQRLDGVAAILKRFRQAVLVAATSGELTREWREERGIEAVWPEVRLGDHAEGFNYGTSTKSQRDGEIPVLRMGNIQAGEIEWGDLVYTSDLAEIAKYMLDSGDILFNRTNSPELVGKTALYRGERPAIYAGYLIRVRCSASLNPEFLNLSLNSPRGRDYCWSVKSDGVSQSNINAKKLAAYPFELPPIDEQQEIARRSQDLFTLADQLEARLTAARKVVDRLTPALLAKAFRGELVPQDPGEEPASVLLERIRAARRAEAGAAKPSRRGRPKAAANPDQLSLDAAPVPPDFLAGLLRECGPLSERALFAVSELQPERFQQQLFRELERGTAREVQANGQVLLEAVG